MRVFTVTGIYQPRSYNQTHKRPWNHEAIYQATKLRACISRSKTVVRDQHTPDKDGRCVYCDKEVK